MHELSLAIDMVAQLEKALVNEGDCAIERVHVLLGVLSGVEPDSFEFCFPVAAEGTRAQGAELVIEKAPIVLSCRACGAESRPEKPAAICQKCLSTDVDIVSGREFIVKSMEVS